MVQCLMCPPVERCRPVQQTSLVFVCFWLMHSIWVSDGFNTTEFLCTAGNNEIIFTSSSNQATIFFSVTSRRTTPAKGFWLLYEGTDTRMLWMIPNLRNHAKFQEMRTDSSSGSSEVIDLGANRKRTCNFRLFVNINFGRILYRFRDINT